MTKQQFNWYWNNRGWQLYIIYYPLRKKVAHTNCGWYETRWQGISWHDIFSFRFCWPNKALCDLYSFYILCSRWHRPSLFDPFIWDCCQKLISGCQHVDTYVWNCSYTSLINHRITSHKHQLKCNIHSSLLTRSLVVAHILILSYALYRLSVSLRKDRHITFKC